MKKAIIYPILLLITVFAACSKDKDKSPDGADKSAEVSQTYQGKLSVGNVDFNNTKIKVTRKAANEVVIEPVSGQEYGNFTALTFSNFIYSDATKQYMSSSGSSRVVIFSFQSNGTIEMSLVNNFQDAMFKFEGTSVK
ncbi:hypothetical protein [Pedobacter heparinus]|uniref:Lipoprotein n=1 Tax=Pedobacter heparinus (strain ATCC 13125 / DSM 2366 / CIP 104194 / JCM 7457 / NBRC 12017 / NCIMB 9290 / NRRL B-14731 / HIM 762-3) TaxID=485917 RepID=C6XY64_PEDHD|nr:hypothetical protein [Pedobacter heparinus]ACU02331.1 hypothetical protein Phep_0105 [Pedobacter heparinus DSM 2366]